MSCFTSIIHEGIEHQIKTGDDICDRYKLGDVVDWGISKDYPRQGTLLDGVYRSCSYPDAEDHWVVIKDHKVHAIFPVEKCTDECDDDCNHPSESELEKKYGIEQLPDSAWSAKGWKRKWERDAKFDKEREEFEASVAHLPPQERFASYLVRPLMRNMDYAGIAKRILSNEPPPPEDPDLYPNAVLFRDDGTLNEEVKTEYISRVKKTFKDDVKPKPRIQCTDNWWRQFV